MDQAQDHMPAPSSVLVAQPSRELDLPHTLQSSSMIYERQLGNREIRLIRLLPDVPGALVRCELFEVSLDQEDAIEYEAISYVWGDPSITQCVVCNGQSVDITVSLYTALRCFRYEDNARILWADALCINQADWTERIQQVSLMGELYHNATNVLAWLGPADPAGEEVMQNAFIAMSIIATLFEYFSTIYNEGLPEEEHLGNSVPQKLTFYTFEELIDKFRENQRSDPFPCLLTFFKHPYWERMWCVQEISLAQKLTIHSGSLIIPGSFAAEFLLWYMSQVHQEEGPVDLELHERLHFCHASLAYHCKYISPKMLVCRDFLQLVQRFRQHRATDPRDEIFGLLGLARHLGLEGPFDVDYSKPCEKVYQDFVKDTVYKRGNLSVLSFVREIVQDERFPSWVPRWDLYAVPSPLSYGAYWSPDLQAVDYPSHELDLESICFAANGVLEVPGVVFDTITSVDDRMNSLADMYKCVGEYVVAEAADGSAVKAGLSADDQHKAAQHALYKIATTFTGGGTRFVVTQILSRVKELEPITELDGTTEPRRVTEVGRQLIQDFRAYVKGCPDPEEPDLDGTNYHKMVSIACQNRCAFTTSKGYLGLGPGCVQIGDVVAVLHGGLYPFILRQTGNKDDKYLLIGESYVYEVVKGNVRGLLKSGGIQETRFKLI